MGLEHDKRQEIRRAIHVRSKRMYIQEMRQKARDQLTENNRKGKGLLPLNMTRAQVVGMFGLATNVPVDSKIVIEEQVYFGDIIVAVESKKAPALNNRYRLPLAGGHVPMVDKPEIDRSEESVEK